MSVKNLLYDRKAPTSKENYVGIELEFLIPYDKNNKLVEDLLKNNLQWNVHLGTDGSVADEDFRPRYDRNLMVANRHEQYTGKEIRILCTEKDAPDVIDSVCKIIKDCDGKVNKTCGLHVHLDMRNRDYETVYNNFYCIQDIMFKMQPESRHKNNYCKKMSRFIKEPRDRYYAINKTAYDKYRTLEIRLHDGSIDAKEIKMWTYFLINIANMKNKLLRKVSKVDKLDLPDIVKGYVNGRINKYAV